MSKNTNLSFLTDYITADITNGRIGIFTASPTVAFDVTGAARVSGVLTLSSTISNGTNTYTLPSATGTLALTSALSSYLPLAGGTLTGALGGTSASFSSTLTSVGATINGANNAIIDLYNTALADTNARNWRIVTNESSWGALEFRVSTANNNAPTSAKLILNKDGAATFSSSVTATTYGVSGTTGAVFTSSAATTAAVYGYINNTSGRFYFGSESSTGGTITTGSTAYYGQIAAQGLQISANTGNNVHVTITPTGNVGIGTTAPAELLVVYGTSASRPRLIVGPITTSTVLYSTFNSQDNPSIEVNTSTASGFAGLTLSNSNNTSGNTLGGISFVASGSSASDKRGAIIVSALESASTTSISSNLYFFTNNANSLGERMRITSGGNVGIGNTNPLSAADQHGLQITAPAGKAAYLRLNFTGLTGLDVIQGGDGTGYLYLRDNNELRFGTNNTTRMTIAANGSIGAPTGTNIYNASDVRLKKNISTTTYGLDTISALNPVKFNWVDGFEPTEDGKDMLGFIAQEVQAVLPEAVESFGGNSVTIGDTVIDNPLRVNEKFIIPVLVKAIQELSAEITLLKNK